MHEFKKSTLKEVLSVIESGSRPSGGVDTESGTIPSLGGENISQDGCMHYDVIKKVHDGFYRNMPRGHLLPYDVLINKDGAQTGKVAIYKGDFPYAAINEHLFLMRGKSNVIEQRFLFYYLLFETTQQQIIKMITGSAQPGINSGFTKHIMINVPPTELQRRIAEILDTIDEAIQKTEALTSKLKSMKQGLLHDLLTCGLDKNGELRDPKAHPEQFKDSPLGRIPKEWKPVRLLDLVSIPNGQVDPKEKLYCHWILIAPDHIESGTGRLLSLETAIEQGAISGKYAFKPGDVLYSKIRPYLRKAVLADRQGLCSADMYPLQPSPFLESRFLLGVILGEHFSRFATSVSERSGFPKINRKELGEYWLALPTMDEQLHIASVIETHDVRIRTEEQYRDKLKLQKKGLMHDLLTGKVRVRT